MDERASGGGSFPPGMASPSRWRFTSSEYSILNLRGAMVKSARQIGVSQPEKRP